MPVVVAVSRDARMRDALDTYLRERGYDVTVFPNYDVLMAHLDPSAPAALVVDVQGVPRGEPGSRFTQFSQWLARIYVDQQPPSLVYLLRKGSRRPHFHIPGPVIKKPFPLEKLGETLRSMLGDPTRSARAPFEVETDTNTLKGSEGSEHLTNIEANLLAYLMAHEGEILHPRTLLAEVWQYHDDAGANTLVRAHVSNLRRKMRSVLGSDEQLETIRGKGYRFVA
ncbi:MAG: response regulator transcription factor [Dehalococcoidia bacterium]|nr:response regulator transcription factor [Dehalococcoidia bacterium]